MAVVKTISLSDDIYVELIKESRTSGRKISQLINHHLREYYKQQEPKMIKCLKCGAEYSSKLKECPN